MAAPRTHRRTAVFWIVGVLGLALVVTTFLSTDLPLGQRFIGALFYLGVGVAGIGNALHRSNLVGRREHERWVPHWHDGPYGGGRLSGVALPCSRPERGLGWLGSMLIGAALGVTAIYLGVSGHAAGSSTAGRVVAIVLSGLFAVILLLGGLAMRVEQPSREAGDLLLTPDALYPGANRHKVAWTAVTGVRTRTAAGGGGRVGAGTFGERTLVDVLGGDDAVLASVDVTTRPDPDTVRDVVTAVWQHPEERGRLAAPAGLAWVQELTHQATAARSS